MARRRPRRIPALKVHGRLGGHYFARRLLAERGYDVAASLALYEQRGGCCDCEILFNVDPVLSGSDREVDAAR